MTRPQISDTLLVAYADGELDPVEARMVELQMANDPALQSRVEMFRRSGRLLQAALGEAEFAAVPAPLARAVRSAVARPRPRIGPVFWRSAAAAVLGLAIGAAGMYVLPKWTETSSPVAHVLHEVAEYHSVFARETDHLVEVPAAQTGEIERWLGARVQLAFKVPDLSGRGLTFQGGRMFAIDGQPVAQLMYTAPQGERIALCVAMSDTGLPPGTERVEDDGFTILGRGEGRHIYIVAGPSGAPVLDALISDLPKLLTGI